MDEGILSIFIIGAVICGVIGMLLGGSVNKGGAEWFHLTSQYYANVSFAFK